MTRALAVLVAASGLAAPLAAGEPAGTASLRPSVLLVLVDDLKPLLGAYGDPRVRTPGIDRLAASGVRFESAYANQAVCAPSRNALLTGLRPTTIGVYDLPTFFREAVPDAVTLPQHFMRNGWRTEALGKVLHTGHGNREDPASWSVPHWSPKGGLYASPAGEGTPPRPVSNEAADAFEAPRGPAVESSDVADDAYADGRIAEEAIRRLRAAAKRPGEPFFLAVGFRKPHLPFAAPARYWRLYERALFEPPARQTPPEGAPEFAPTTWGELRRYSDVPDVGPLSVEQQRELIHGYHAAVSYVDAQVGRVLDELDRLGLTGHTLVVLWGDHGWHLGDHGMWAKHTNYEQAARIPLVVRAPGVTRAAAAARALVETVDIYPTLCELAGLPVPAGLDGRSFVPALRQPGADGGKEAVFHVYPRTPRGLGPLLGRAVRTRRHRLIEWKAAGAPLESAVLELYDYEKDPGETRNLATDEPKTVATLRALLAARPEARPQVEKRLPPS